MQGDDKQFLAHKELSKKAEKDLDKVLAADSDDSIKDALGEIEESESTTKSGTKKRAEKKKTAKQVPEEKVIGSNRQDIRVLLLTDDSGVYVAGSEAHMQMQLYGELFDELHIIVLSEKNENYKTTRLSENVWVYPTNSVSKYHAVFDAYKRASEQLSFASGFRTDLILAVDPFEAGLAGVFLAKKFNRAIQIELKTDCFSREFRSISSSNTLKVLMSRYVLKRAGCVRTTSEYIKNEAEKRYKNLVGKVDVVPFYIDLKTVKHSEPITSLHDRFPQFKFFILFVDDLVKKNDVRLSIVFCSQILYRYPSAALVIVGSGPEKTQLKRIAADLKLDSQVIFEDEANDIVSYMKTANIFLNIRSYEEYNENLIKAAAAGLPVLTTNVGYPETLFVNGVSGIVCAPGNVDCFVKGIQKYLSNNESRSTFALNAQDKVFKTIESDVSVYLKAYRTSMEKCIINYSENAEGKKHE